MRCIIKANYELTITEAINISAATFSNASFIVFGLSRKTTPYIFDVLSKHASIKYPAVLSQSFSVPSSLSVDCQTLHMDGYASLIQIAKEAGIRSLRYGMVLPG
ncbi:hypothetical protein VKT23_009135 [Stygiomarasmius scandens]|uniref:Uncharacterized protein n=1 Tax=Marasmiellus scandens TaxID=2682957 RepID=A0ABR1JGX1_9AGAR